jgi:peptide/nickel transport system permease protein
MTELFAVTFHIFPATGYVSPSTSITGWARSLVLPVIALSLGPITVIAQQTRDAVAEVMGRPFIRSLTSYGLSRKSVIFRHALRNAGNPILTVSGLMFVALLTGTIFVEQVFGLPGLGSAVVTATSYHDVPIIQGVAIYFVLMVIAVNLMTDVAYMFLNPRELLK